MPSRDFKATLLSTILITCAGLADAEVAVNGLDQHGLVLVGPGSVDYSKWVVRAIGQARPPGVEAMLPYSVILRNTSKRRIIFYTIRWTSTSNNGVATHDDRMFYNLGGVRGGFDVDPGSTWLVSPIGALNRPLKNESASEFNNQFQMSRMDFHFLQQSRVVISLDFGIFADGEIVGPDTTRSLDHVTARLAAAHDLGTAFEGCFQRREPVPLCVSKLQQQASSPDSNPNKWYAYYQKKLLEELIRANERGEAALKERLRQSFRTTLRLHRDARQ